MIEPTSQLGSALTRQPVNSNPGGWINTEVRSTESGPAPPPSLLQNEPLPSEPSVATAEDQLLPSSPEIAVDDDKLQDFQKNMSNYFPFVVVPPGINAAGLRSVKPHLYDNIIMIASYHDVSRQLKLRSQIIRNTTERIFLHGEKSLDLLQGLLLFVAWYHHYLGVSPQLTNLIQLATALVFDLGLHKPYGTGNFHDVFIDTMRSFNDKHIKNQKSLEEKRAYLGLFYLTNV